MWCTVSDVWGSTDGSNWALIGGQTLAYGKGQSSVVGQTATTSPSYSASTSFFTEGGLSMKCQDKSTGQLYLLSGFQYNPATLGYGLPVRQNAYVSTDGQTWTNLTSGFTPPGRGAGWCFVDSSSRIFVLGGTLVDGSNAADVWMGTVSGSGTQTWQRQTGAASWAGRNGLRATYYRSSVLNTQIITMSAGYVTNVGAANDVWASSDNGVTWVQTTAAAPFQIREHGALLASSTGVLITTMGGPGELQTDDLWASLDGGITWGSCTGSTAANSSEAWAARKVAAAVLDSSDSMWVSAGLDQFYSSLYSTGVEYQAFNDVWKSSIGFTSASVVASNCNLTVPSCGVGVQCWPPTSSCAKCSSSGAAAPRVGVVTSVMTVLVSVVVMAAVMLL